MDDVASPQERFRYAFDFEGKKVWFSIDDPIDEVQKHILAGTFYELDQLSHHRTLIPRDAKILDAGANIGNHTVYYAIACGARRVTSVEPNARAALLLKEAVGLNNLLGSVEVVPQVALGGGSAWGLLDQAEADLHNLGGVSVGELTDASTPGAVPIQTGDSLLDGEQVDFVKIDVEGNEMQVLAGLQATIDRYQPVLAVEVMKPNRSEFALWLRRNRYRIDRTFQMYAGILNYVCLRD